MKLEDIKIGLEVVYLIPGSRTGPLPVLGVVEAIVNGQVDIRVPQRPDAPSYMAQSCDPRFVFPAQACGMSLKFEDGWHGVDPSALARGDQPESEQ